jgi:hypothetical protein
MYVHTWYTYDAVKQQLSNYYLKKCLHGTVNCEKWRFSKKRFEEKTNLVFGLFFSATHKLSTRRKILYFIVGWGLGVVRSQRWESPLTFEVTPKPAFDMKMRLENDPRLSRRWAIERNKRRRRKSWHFQDFCVPAFCLKKIWKGNLSFTFSVFTNCDRPVHFQSFTHMHESRSIRNQFDKNYNCIKWHMLQILQMHPKLHKLTRHLMKFYQSLKVSVSLSDSVSVGWNITKL